MSRRKPLTKQRRCHNHTDGLHDYNSFCREDKFCPNYVNMKKPRKQYWQRWSRTAGYAEKMCWAYICDWCHEDLQEDNDYEWPTNDRGQFLGSMECSLP